MKKYQKLRISVLLLTAICLSCFLFYACQKQQLPFSQQHGESGDKITATEARAYFDKNFPTSKNASLRTNSRVANETAFDETEKTPIWDASLSKMISTGTNAIVIPLEKKGVFVKTRNNKMVPFGFLNYLMMYKDSTNAIITEWVSLSPSEKYFSSVNGGPYDGLIFVMDWNGNLKKSFSFKDGVGGKWEKGHNIGNNSIAENRSTSSEETVMSSPNPPDCVLITFYTQIPGQGWYCTCNQHPTYDATCNCQAYTVAPRLETNTFLRCVNDPPVDEDPDFPNPPTGGGENPVGSGPGGSGDPNDYNPTNCNPDPDYVVPSTPPPPGQEWILPCRDLIPPEETDVPGITDPNAPSTPYVCNYVMTAHEQSVFDDIDQEDNQADQEHENLDCKGTKRTGNYFFYGTTQHWIIQLDYVSREALFGEAEFKIPYASGNNPNQRGYADLVNLGNGNIFEIKPNNDAGLTSGANEVTNYVNKANQHCTSTLPTGVIWNKGTTYSTRYLPFGTNKGLKVELKAPGVITYEEYNLPTPVPDPIVVPTSVVEKFKHLIDRLKGNLGNADKIIAEYMQQNPDLVNYIKTAAIGAGIAIIVGTIIEDVLTAGAGIADDWACFVTAYRIIRFAIKL